MIEMMAIAKNIVTYMGKFAAKKMERNHKVLKLLEAAGIGALKEEFDSIYAHALVAYGVDAKSLDLVKLFASKEVKNTFKQELYKDEQKVAEVLDRLFRDKKKMAYLTHVFKSKEDFIPEVQRFGELYDYFTTQSAKPFLRKKYNEDNAFQLKMLEENRRKSFDFQAEKYLQKLIDDFYKEFLEKNHYIDLNGETRVLKPGHRPGGFHEVEALIRKDKGEQKTEPPYESIPLRPLDKYMNEWLRDDRVNVLVIIGEYGTGKTTFLRHMAHQLASNRMEPGSGTAITDAKNRLPLFFPLRNFEKKIESYIISQLNADGIIDIDYARFLERINSDELVILLDGFDEMTQRIDADEKTRNFDKIRRLIEHSPKSNIVLTTRQEYFHSTADLEAVFKHRDKENYRLIYLLPFDDDQIQQYLNTHTDDSDYYWKQIKEIFDLHDLAKRPVLLELIVTYLPKLLEEKGEKDTINASDLYSKCIETELDRKNRELKPFLVPGKHRLEILQKLAVWMFLNDALSIDMGLLEQELNLRHYFKTDRAWEFEKYLNEFLTFTFLIREADNRYRISHKSFRDYLTAQAFVKEINSGKIENFGRNRTTRELNHFIGEQLPGKEALLDIVLNSRNLPEDRQWQGTNAANVLLRMDRKILKAKNLSGCLLPFVDFRGCDLTGTNFKNADLSNCEFNRTVLSAWVKNTNFENATLDLEGSVIKDLVFLKEFKNVSVLYLYGNPITDISALTQLKNLRVLRLENTPITNISALKELKNLIELHLYITQVTDISVLKELKNLQYLFLSRNQIPGNQRRALKKAIPGIKIGFV